MSGLFACDRCNAPLETLGAAQTHVCKAWPPRPAPDGMVVPLSYCTAWKDGAHLFVIAEHTSKAVKACACGQRVERT